MLWPATSLAYQCNTLVTTYIAWMILLLCPSPVMRVSQLKNLIFKEYVFVYIIQHYFQSLHLIKRVWNICFGLTLFLEHVLHTVHVSCNQQCVLEHTCRFWEWSIYLNMLQVYKLWPHFVAKFWLQEREKPSSGNTLEKSVLLSLVTCSFFIFLLWR